MPPFFVFQYIKNQKSKTSLKRKEKKEKKKERKENLGDQDPKDFPKQVLQALMLSTTQNLEDFFSHLLQYSKLPTKNINMLISFQFQFNFSISTPISVKITKKKKSKKTNSK